MTATYTPKLEETAKARTAELEETSAKVRSGPDRVKARFDMKITNLDNRVLKEMMKNATAGI